MILTPHTRGWAVWGRLPGIAGLYLMQTFTSLIAARSFIGDNTPIS